MSYGICPLSTVAIRNSSSHKSEMISQLLFGELVEFLEVKGRQWVKVRCHWDNFVGWVASNQLQAITPSEYNDYRQNFAYCLELFQPLMSEQHFIPITIGAQLPNFDGMRLALIDKSYHFSGQAVFPKDIQPNKELILKIARKYLNVPYAWGGRSPMGIDSAGLVQVVFKMGGFKLPREAAQQVYLGNAVDFVEQAIAGDLAFFENRVGRISHVGIILPEKQILHAYGRVRIDTLDHFGIYNREENRYTHKLRLIKRVLPSNNLPNPKESKKAASVTNQVELF